MRNKLQPALATLHCFALSNFSKSVTKMTKVNYTKSKLISMFCLVFLFLFTTKSFAQLTETFDTGIPNTWINKKSIKSLQKKVEDIQKQ